MNPWLVATVFGIGMWLAASIPFALYAAHLLKHLGEVELNVETEDDTH